MTVQSKEERGLPLAHLSNRAAVGNNIKAFRVTPDSEPER